MVRIWALALQILLSFHLARADSTMETSLIINPNSQSFDVAVIGGGAAGTYAAIRIHQSGHSVALIEKQSRLGGHVNTYIDPTTKQTFDYGVTGYTNNTAAANFFNYLDIPTTPYSAPSASSYVDLKTDGKLLNSLPSNILWGNEEAIGAAIPIYAAQFAKYPFLANGGFNLPDPIPEELLMDTGSFLEKYNVTALAGLIDLQCEGAGNILARPMVYTFQCASFSGTDAFVTTTAHDNQAIYNNAQAKLGSNSVFLDSNVLKITRPGASKGYSSSQIEILFSDLHGLHTIKAKKLIIAIPQTLPNLKNLGLDLVQEESSLYAQFNYTYYWDMVLANTGLSSDLGIIYPVDLSAPLAIPAQPSLLPILPAESDGFPQFVQAYYGSVSALSDDQVKANVFADIEKIIRANGLQTKGPIEFVRFHNHAPYALGVSNQAIKDGFYGKLNALQGQRGTYCTGAAYHGEDSSGIWEVFEDNVLPLILDALKS